MKNRTRIAAGFLAAVICFIMLFSVCYIAAESHHDCTGDNCMVCYHIKSCIITIKNTALALTAAAVCLSAVYFVITESKNGATMFFDSTLVSLKVKLSA